jgi:hypothetical protein
MARRILARSGVVLALTFSLTHCGGDESVPVPGSAVATTGGASASGGTPGTGASPGTGGGATGGVSGSGGGASGGTSGAGGSPTGGGSGSGGATGGAPPGPEVDADGKALAAPGDSTTTSTDYLNLGDMRLLNNVWGSDERGCNTPLSVFVNTDGSVGWTINRGSCGGEGTQPDFPEIEFGVHPFGAGSELETSPPFPSTTVLPLQIKDITSASVVVDGMSIALQAASSWNLSFEFWLSQRDPVSEPNPGVYAEILGMWGWQDDRWPCGDDANPGNEYQGMTVAAGDKSYDLCHQSDTWANGQWRYFQFRMQGGPSRSFSGRVDVKAFIDWVVSARGYSRDYWVTRMEVGSEIDDNTNATVTIRDLTFEVNGQSESIRLAQ